MEATQVHGTITEKHVEQVRQCFGDKVAERLDNAKPGETFLTILFVGYADEMKQSK